MLTLQFCVLGSMLGTWPALDAVVTFAVVRVIDVDFLDVIRRARESGFVT